MVSLEDSWKEATEGLDAAICNAWFTRLQEVYSEERRTYHNLDSLREKLNHYYDIKGNLKNPRAVLLAIFFQNFEYDPKALDGEDKNLEHFNIFADEAEIPSDAELRGETCALLKVAATHSTEAHKVGGAFGGEDAHYFLDLDMAVLGSSPDSYAEYRERIRGEYSFLSEPMYTALRLKMLVIGVAELPADPEHLRHHGVSRQAGGTGAPEHPDGGGAAVLEFSVVSLSFSEGSNRKRFPSRSLEKDAQKPSR
ncbi:hypothetical protein RF55_5216 [Lasius niger]|uniref:Uncharacterized protein n=1 Tax=Lasius niger TaxID=67767 RepID=A0A0J7NQB2_LASNI|nr:hypothetical protein RF55_5216 [Lasius niger]